MNIISYVQDSIVDGEGLRDVLFVSACSHKCVGCHNTESWSPTEGTFFTKKMKAKLIQEAKRLSLPAITLSGGDPLYETNYKEVVALCKELKQHGINIWLYTGYTLEQVKEIRPLILPHIDVLVDGKYVEELKDPCLKFKGSTNQNIIRRPFK